MPQGVALPLRGASAARGGMSGYKNTRSNEMTDLEILKLAVKTLDSKKGHDIKVIRIADVSSVADYFVLVTGTSATQVKTLADETEMKLKAAGVTPERTVNHRGAEWVVLDYVNVVIHIFYKDARAFYDLERLWEDGDILEIEALLK